MAKRAPDAERQEETYTNTREVILKRALFYCAKNREPIYEPVFSHQVLSSVGVLSIAVTLPPLSPLLLECPVTFFISALYQMQSGIK